MKKPTGIVLIGGQSTRMGTDKSRLKIDNKYFYQGAAQKLLPYCDEIFLSINGNQASLHKYEYPIIIDKYPNQGPISGILSCYEAGHNHILILATDLIHIQSSDIQSILQIHQNDSQDCTMYYNENTGYYEPMLSIWNKTMLIQLKIYFENGGRSLQKFLISHSIALHPLKNENNFKNINAPSDLDY